MSGLLVPGPREPQADTGLWTPDGLPAAVPRPDPKFDYEAAARGLRRIRHLRARAAKKPLGSNGREKDLEKADRMIDAISRAAHRCGVSPQEFETFATKELGA